MKDLLSYVQAARGVDEDPAPIDSNQVLRITLSNLQRAIDLLPPGFKAIFILHDVQGYKHSEIGGILRCSTGNSKSQLHKARMRLRALLKGALHNSPLQTRESTVSSPVMKRRDYSLDNAKA